MAKSETKIIVGADTSKYERGMRNIQNLSARTANKIKSQFKTAAVVMTGVGVAVGALSKDLIGLSMAQERAELSLGAAMKAADEYTETAHKSLLEFASGIQEVTEYGDEEVLMLAALIKNLGVTTDRLDETTKTAIGLAAATGRGAESMAQYVALAEQGEFTMLRRYIPALRKTTDAAEQLKIVQDFAARGFIVAEENAKTFSGRLKQMANLWGDLRERAGDAFVKNEEIIKLLDEGKVQLIAWIGDTERWVKANDKLIAQKTKETIIGIKESIEGIIDIYQKLPEGVIGAAGFGIIGTMLFGPQAGAVIALIALTSSKIDQFKRDHPEIFAPEKPKALTFFAITRPSAAPPPPAEKKAPGMSPVTQEEMDAWTAGSIALDELQKKKQLFYAMDDEMRRAAAGRMLSGTIEAEQARLDALGEFNRQYAEIGKSQFDLEREGLQRQTELWQQHGWDKEKIAQLTANKLAAINKAETQQRINNIRDVAGSMSDGFKMISEMGGKHNKKAFAMYKAFKIIETTIATYSGAMKAYESLVGIPFIGPFIAPAAAAATVAFGMAQIAMIKNAQPPSYDRGGISNAEGLYRTGPIKEAHIPIPSGGKIPVQMNGGQRPVQIILNNPVFQDLETQRRVFVQLAEIVAARVAPGAVVQNYKNDGEIRQMTRGGM